MWRALTTYFIAPPKLEPLSSVPSVTATGISLLLHAASPVCPEVGEMGTGGAGAIIVALLRSRHACCGAADESSPLVVWVQVDDEGAKGRAATRWCSTVPCCSAHLGATSSMWELGGVPLPDGAVPRPSARPAWALPRCLTRLT